ncbi:beta-lactamase/transpeptidase-like protein [Xylariaceae sp. FL1272]|nr:beta-lactamase/transpeptidase-like protein [Xylariaceae sp. FL1272]
MERQLQDRIPVMEKVLSTTAQPGMSVGVIYQGEKVFHHHVGFRDVESGQSPNDDTLYCIASLTKAFIAASIDVLVQEGKLSWDQQVNSVLRNTNCATTPTALSNVTLRDICSHRTGLLSLDEITQGLDSRILIPKRDCVRVCEALPAKHELRSHFLYNNALYDLAGHVIEIVSGSATWGDFVIERILSPLGLSRTTPHRNVHITDSNIAIPYKVLSDGSLFQTEPTELSADSMNGASGGIRSSIGDMLKWSSCLLDSICEPSKPNPVLRQNSPIFKRCIAINNDCVEDGDYCLGWCMHRTPAHLGSISPNRSLQSPLLGANSPSILLYSHQGDVPGYTSSIYIVPESRSAVVVLSNGTGLSDATDWVAQDLVQTMHRLQPAIDFGDIAALAADKYIRHYADNFSRPLTTKQVRGTSAPRLDQLIGPYTMEGLDAVFVQIIRNRSKPEELLLIINDNAGQAWNLWHYNYDVFCYLPRSFDEYLSRGFDRLSWESFLISFSRGEHGSIVGLSMMLDAGVSIKFKRVGDTL